MNGITITHAQRLRTMPASLTFRCFRTSDCKRVLAAWALYEDVSSRYSYEKGWAAPNTPLPQPYEIRSIESKGRGMVALRGIKREEVIVNERPTILTPRVTYSSDSMNVWKALDETLLQLLYWLEQEDRQKVVQLHNCKSLDECGPLVGILRTNAIGISFPESHEQRCVPNSIYSLDKSTMIFTLRAIRDIAPGEEISITYLSNDETSAVRKVELQDKYGFICSCILCSAPTDAVVASDERRKFIKSTNSFIKHMWQDWLKIAPEARRAQATQNAKTVEKLSQAMDVENIHVGRMDAMQKCVYMYAVLCDVKNFKKWARRCLKVAKGKGEGTFGREGLGGLFEGPDVVSSVGSMEDRSCRFHAAILRTLLTCVGATNCRKNRSSARNNNTDLVSIEYESNSGGQAATQAICGCVIGISTDAYWRTRKRRPDNSRR